MLTGKQIWNYRKEGHIIIEPYHEEQLQPNGYDLTIGPWVIRYKTYGKQQRSTTELDRANVNFIFAEPDKMNGYITFRPMERMLCHSQEIIGSTDKCVMQISTRSTLARWGIDVCGSAGFGDVGFVNKWTLELQNNTHGTIAIPIGARVAQAYFEELIDDIESKYTGVYNSNVDEGGDIYNWKPHNLLPKVVRSEWREDNETG